MLIYVTIHGGLTLNFKRHNDITVQLLSKVCKDVTIKPLLQTLSGKKLIPQTANQQDDARADIHAHGFWAQQQAVFFDVHPNAPSFRENSVPSINFVDAT